MSGGWYDWRKYRWADEDDLDTATAWKWILLVAMIAIIALTLFAYGYTHDWGCDPHDVHDRGDRCYVG
jgi:hypothetical protein